MKKFLSLMILGSLLQSLAISQSQAIDLSFSKTVKNISDAVEGALKGPPLEIALTADEIYETHMDDHIKKLNDYFKAKQLISRSRWNDAALAAFAAMGVAALTVNSSIRNDEGNLNSDYFNLDPYYKNGHHLPVLSSYVIGIGLAGVFGFIKTRIDTDFYYEMNDVEVERVEKSLQYIRRHADASCQARGAKGAIFDKREFLALVPIKLSEVKKTAFLDGEKLAKDEIVKDEIYLVFDPKHPLMCSQGWFKSPVPLASLIGKLL